MTEVIAHIVTALSAFVLGALTHAVINNHNANIDFDEFIRAIDRRIHQLKAAYEAEAADRKRRERDDD